MKKLIASTLCTFLVGPVMAMSFNLSELNKFDDATKSEIKTFIQGNKVISARPAHCPSSSENYSALLTKISTIKDLFLSSCLDATTKQIDAILAGAADLEDSLTAYNETVAEVDADAVADTDEIDGEKIATVVNGLSNILTINSCSEEENRTFLNKSASVLSEIAQIGLLTTSGNGLIVSAGGFALAAVLTSIDNYLTPDFDFRDPDSRATYNTLNCAFYDLRREIEIAGLFDVNTSLHQDKLTEAKSYLKKIEAKITEIEKQYTTLASEVTQDKLLKRDEEMVGLVELKGSLSKVLTVINANSEETTSSKIALMGNMAYTSKFVIDQMEHYTNAEIENKIPFLDMAFKANLKKLSYDNLEGNQEIYAKKNEDFFKNYIAEIKAHTDRILTSIETYQVNWLKSKKESIMVNGKKLDEYSKEILADKTKVLAELTAEKTSLNAIIEKYTLITNKTRFTRKDDGSDNKQTILDNYNAIVNQIFGTNGLRYLDEMAQRSITASKEFSKEYKDFEQTYSYDLYDSENNVIKVEDDRVKQSICTNAQNLRILYNNAETLAQLGYDFIATNIDLFADSDDTIKYLKTFDDVERVSKKRLTNQEEILFHKASAQLAKKVMANEEVPEKAKKILFKDKWIGEAMNRVNQRKTIADLIQIIIEKQRCSEVTEMD